MSYSYSVEVAKIEQHNNREKPLNFWDLTHYIRVAGRKISHLRINDSIEFNDRFLSNLISSICNISALRLESCHLITNEGLRALNRLENLTHLSVFNCKQITDLSSLNLKNLKEIHFECPNLSEISDRFQSLDINKIS